MRLTSIIEADFGRRGFLRGLAGAAVSPTSIPKLALGVALPALSGLAAAVSAYKQSGLDDERLKEFTQALFQGIRPWDALKAKTEREAGVGSSTTDPITGAFFKISPIRTRI